MAERPNEAALYTPDADSGDSETDKNRKAFRSPLGVDVGTCRISVCRKTDQGLITESQLNAFFSVPYLKFTQEILEKNRMSYFVDDDSLVIIGDMAEKFSVVMNAEIRRPIREGLLNPMEAKGQKVIEKLLEQLIAQPESLGETVCLNIPAVPSNLQHRLIYHTAILRKFFMSRGYRVKTIYEGLAVVLSELAETQFSGIGISLGGGMCNCCLAYLSLPILMFSIPKAGDYIDDSVAAVMNMLPTEVRLIKENELDLSRSPHNRVENALHIFYDELISNVLEGLKKSMLNCNKLPQIGQPVPMVLGGGTVMPRGFLERFEKTSAEFNFPIPISGVKLAHEPMTAPVRGAFIAASSGEKPLETGGTSLLEGMREHVQGYPL